MGQTKYTKDECIEKILQIQDEIGLENVITQSILREYKLYKTVVRIWGNITCMKSELGIPQSKRTSQKKYTDNELILIIKNFEKENSFFPSSEYWGEHSSKLGLPCCNTYNQHFGSWRKVRELCENYEYDYMIEKNGKYVNKYNNKEMLNQILHNYVNENNKVPTLKELNNLYGQDLHHCIYRYFDSYTDYIIKNGYKPVGHSIYSDEDLEIAFRNFVKENKRVPTIRELKERSDLPGEKAYKLRFGTWGKACIYYGYKPNNRQPEYYLKNGERCDSSYECMTSNWLSNNNISYERNIKYKDIDAKYKGLMNCDYLVHTDKDWYIEIAGMLWSKDYIPTTEETIKYHQKLELKEKILRQNKLNYKIIYANDFKNNALDDIFSFLR